MTSDQSPTPDELQFDQAEFENVTENQIECSACKSAIAGSYYDANGTIVCPGCREQIEASLTGGSGIGRFAKAILFGVPAAAVGSGIYYGIAALTGYEFGLVAIVIGLLVGFAVRAGSERRGGWPYQSLAMMLTYIAIVSTYIPGIIQGLQDAETAENAGISQPASPADNETASSAPENAAPPETTGPEEASIVWGVVAIGILMTIAMAAPFLMGFENIIGLIIIAIGLYEAWKLNKRTKIVITGPYDVATAAAPAEAPDRS